MERPNHTARQLGNQAPIYELRSIFSQLDDAQIIQRLAVYRWTGRRGYRLKALLRAYVASFYLNLPHTNALIRRLAEDPALRKLCGFHGRLPHRSTFNRFIQRLNRHPDLVEIAVNGLVNRLRRYLPDLGKIVAVDSTTVRTHSNPNRRRITDGDASWSVKNKAGAPNGKEANFGYKIHLIADARHGVPLTLIVSTGKDNDSPYLPGVFSKMGTLLPWVKPEYALADRGYDSLANHKYLTDKGIAPIIAIRRRPTGRKGQKAAEQETQDNLVDGVYTYDGVPTCIGQVPMEYVRSDPRKGWLYRCAGCHLKDSTRGGITHCDSEVWEDPTANIRLFGAVRRRSPEWKRLYRMRQAIERVFKSLKESRRLERHCVRGLAQVRLHSMMAVLVYQATVLVALQEGRHSSMRWQVRKVA